MFIPSSRRCSHMFRWLMEVSFRLVSPQRSSNLHFCVRFQVLVASGICEILHRFQSYLVIGDGSFQFISKVSYMNPLAIMSDLYSPPLTRFMPRDLQAKPGTRNLILFSPSVFCFLIRTSESTYTIVSTGVFLPRGVH